MDMANKATSSDGTTIAFERSGEGPALIAVDAAGSYRDFRPLRPPVELLAEHFTVYLYDRRGRGASTDTLPYAVEREVDDLAALIAEAGGSAYVYAMSSGSLLALHAAASGLAIPKLALFEPRSSPPRPPSARPPSRPSWPSWWPPAAAGTRWRTSTAGSACPMRSWSR
jgi:pimeloyl-ACP methyl ester carboxylesterase